MNLGNAVEHQPRCGHLHRAQGDRPFIQGTQERVDLPTRPGAESVHRDAKIHALRDDG